MTQAALAAPSAAARALGLRYVTDRAPGIRRVPIHGHVRYEDARGRAVKDKATLARIKALVIPPAWTHVWICPDARGHIQATGRDARGRKQYRYHAEWRRARDETKFARMRAFALALPRIRARVRRDLARKGLPREKVLATIVRLLETTYMRVGNDEYRRANGSHGITTLQDRHATIRGAKVTFSFRGKSGKTHVIDVEDKRLAHIVRRCQELPGQELFQYLDDDGKVVDVGSADVNAYLREISREDFTAKDFRTWAGTVLAAIALREMLAYDSEAQAKRQVVRAIERVAERLGNTPAVCRKCYVHPEVLGSYLDGTFAQLAAREARAQARASGLKAEERAVLRVLGASARPGARAGARGRKP
ncbi:MAG TPA: DNA topoisomerase IB [Candidatus Thermoplasmatota archaeon]|nr:DNA topoisomerase IB [Candidatus Thermoplasmatota archaeon]